MQRVGRRSRQEYNTANAGSAWRGLPMLVSGVALMAGVFASSGAQAQCTASGTQAFPFGGGTGVNALTSAVSTVNTAFLINGSPFVSAPAATGPDQLGGGLWVRGVGGSVETKANSSISGELHNPYLGDQPINSSCRTKVEQDFGGFQAGQDIALLNNSNTGVNLHFGVLAGYIGTNFHDETPGGTLKGNFDVPFAGVYTTLSKGNFFADAQTRFDYYQGNLTDSANGIGNERIDARGYSVTANMGYRLSLGGNWTAEPSVGGVYSFTQANSFNVPGVFDISQMPSPWTSYPGAVKIHDMESELGRATVKVGTTAALGDSAIIAYPFASASVYHEFAGNVTATITPGAGGFTALGNLTTSRVGTYAQFSVGSAFQLADSGWLSYVRADYRTGENIEGYALNAGLRYQLNSDAGGSKDGGSLKDGPADAFSWTGLYIGASAGDTWGDTSWNPGHVDNAGFLGGGQLGYNYQIGHLVLGVEGGYQVSNARGGSSTCTQMSPTLNCENDVMALGSVAGRLGYSFGRMLVYGKGGWAFGDIKAGMHRDDTGLGVLAGSQPAGASSSQWENGWTGGAGVEFALTDKWSAKAEYMHYDFSGKNFMINQIPAYSNISASGDYVTIGVNYHLDILRP